MDSSCPIVIFFLSAALVTLPQLTLGSALSSVEVVLSRPFCSRMPISVATHVLVTDQTFSVDEGPAEATSAPAYPLA